MKHNYGDTYYRISNIKESDNGIHADFQVMNGDRKMSPVIEGGFFPTETTVWIKEVE